MQSGELLSNTMVASNIENDASLAQALYMVENATFENGTLWALRSQVDGVQHLAGSSFTQYGDMNEHGRSTSADCRHTNNRLEGHPCVDLYNLTSNERLMLGTQSNSSSSNERETITEEEMILVAISQSLQQTQTPYTLTPAGLLTGSRPALLPRYQTNDPPVSAQYATASAANPMETQILVMQGINAAALKSEETPMFVVNTRKHLIGSRRKNHANMSNDEKRKHAKVIDGLSKPYNTALINVLKSVEEEATPEKAKELLSIMEDMEGVQFDKYDGMGETSPA
jgi:hypothetical protein